MATRIVEEEHGGDLLLIPMKANLNLLLVRGKNLWQDEQPGLVIR